MRRSWFARAVGTAALILVGTSSLAVADEGPNRADERQAQQFYYRLRNAPDLANNRIPVEVDDGIAVLEGTVDSEHEKKEAQALAHVEGILGVNNRLVVRSVGK